MFMNGSVSNYAASSADHWRDIDRSFLSNNIAVPGYGPHIPLPPNVRLNHILRHPSLEVRAIDLGYFITYTQADDLKSYFPAILETIFGFKNNVGWGLRMLTRQTSRDTDAILRFLSPADGALINLTYRLMEDANLRYEYPVECLPKPLADRICSGDIPSFFANKINTSYSTYSPFNQRSNTSKTLLLNPFEYYFTFFGMGNIFGVTGEYGGNYLTGWGSSADSVYSILFEEYLAFFFPCNGQGVPAASYIQCQSSDAPYLSSQSPIHRHQYSTTRPKPNGIGNVMRRPSMFKESVFQEQGEGGILTREKTYHAMQPYAQKETWRSDTILHLCMELWMNVEDSKLPSVDLVKSVRMLVRHVHYFINNTNTVALHPMEDIKRQTYPIFQKKLYIFLKDLFQRWPMDNSFRIVYETWLSYIQPWRYLQYNKCSKNRDFNEQIIDNRWYNFMLENILFYTTLFLQLLPRFQRVDLTTPKNALMLFRVSKIFTISENIKLLLREVEKNLDIVNAASYSWNGAELLSHQPGIGSAYQRQLGAQSSNLVYSDEKLYTGLGLGSPNQNLRVVHVKQMLKELESPQFVYVPLFSQEIRNIIKKIVICIHQASDALKEGMEKTPGANQTPSLSWYQWFTSAFYVPDVGPTGPEKVKAYNQLEFAQHQLCLFFDIPLDEVMSNLSHSESFYGNISHDHSCDENSSITAGGDSRNLIIASKILRQGQVTNNMMTSIGNPDEALPRRDESRLILRLCNAIASWLNNKYGAEIERRYFERSLLGKFCRVIFARPQEYSVIEKKKGQRPSKVLNHLPPRVSLRFMASTKTWYFILSLFVAAMYFKLSPLGTLFWGFMLAFLYVSCGMLKNISPELIERLPSSEVFGAELDLNISKEMNKH